MRANERTDERVAQYCSLYSWLFWSTVPEVQLVHEAGDKFQGFTEVGGTDAPTAVEEDGGVQFERRQLQAGLVGGQSAGLPIDLAIKALEILGT